MTDDTQLTFFDAHMHLWKPANGWYSSLWEEPERDPATGQWRGIGDWRRLRRDVTVADYRASLVDAPVRLGGCVHVTAAKRAWLAETRWLTEVAAADGLPTGIVVYVDPTSPPRVALREFDAHLEISPLVRGLRFLHSYDIESPTIVALLNALADRGLVFDLVHDTSNLSIAATLAARFDGLRMVLEHAGWPKSVDLSHFTEWAAGMRRLAEQANVWCKLSGLGMTTRSNTAEVLRPWVDVCLSAFGTDRCLVATNFPVDTLYGSVADLLASYDELLAGASEAERRAVFAGNALRVYGLEVSSQRDAR